MDEPAGRQGSTAGPAAGRHQTLDPATFDAQRPYLLGVAYRMLGTISEAEDVVQETWIRASAAWSPDIGDPRRWLTVIATRISLDVLKSARVQRERYVGEWLPEPLVDRADPADRVTLDDSISLALMVVLESLSPAERTAFVLHDVFGLSFEEVAEAVGRTPAACRQLAVRARAHIRERAPRFDRDDDSQERLVQAFVRAAEGGSLDDLIAVLDPDVVLRSDGGGKVPARRRPVVSAADVAALVLQIMRQRPDTVFSAATVNGSAGLITTNGGEVSGVIGFATTAAGITELHLIMNPDKLREVPNPSAWG